MLATQRFRPFVSTQINEWKSPNMYLISSEQGNDTYSVLFYVHKEKHILRNDIEGRAVGDVWGVVGKCIHLGNIIQAGVMIDYVILDYTKYMRMETSALRIQRSWRLVRMMRAADKIARAWKRWLVKKNELWNLRCFVGVAYLCIEAIKETRRD